MEPQARFEFALHGTHVHEVSRPPPLWETNILIVSYQGGDLTSLSYWGFHMTIIDCHFAFRMKSVIKISTGFKVIGKQRSENHNSVNE